RRTSRQPSSPAGKPGRRSCSSTRAHRPRTSTARSRPPASQPRSGRTSRRVPPGRAVRRSASPHGAAAAPQRGRDPPTAPAARPTVLHVTPARAALLVAAAALCEATLEGVRLVVVGGDALPETLVPDLRALCPAATVANAYGTTEIPQVASLHFCGEGADRVYVPIGRGTGSRELVVLQGSELAGVGELGEIGVVDTLPPARLAGRPLPTREVGGRR